MGQSIFIEEGGSGSIRPFIFVQSTDASVWTIDHHLGHYPAVTIIGNDGREKRPSVTHPDVNTTVLTFSPVPMSGTATLI